MRCSEGSASLGLKIAKIQLAIKILLLHRVISNHVGGMKTCTNL